MLKLVIDLFGSRGSSSGGAGGGGASSSSGETFKSLSDFDKALTGFDDPRLKEYTDARDSFKEDISLTKNIIPQIDETGGLGKMAETLLESQKKDAENKLKNLPKEKTPAQFGEEEGLNELIDAIDKVFAHNETLKGKKTSPYDNVDVTI